MFYFVRKNVLECLSDKINKFLDDLMYLLEKDIYWNVFYLQTHPYTESIMF